ncbi:MAG: rhomboid family intramembrane serine protease [Anaerolineales bacterium]|nr:MAG: rhomboid family intramembrane serine protease [Anaerolineales bacterium]
MFPLRDTVRSRSFPFVTYGLIAVNIIIFLFEASLGPRSFNTLLDIFGLVPARISTVQLLSFITPLTSVFLHGSWFHLISNMWTLFIFGDNVEDRMGPTRFLVFYLIAGVVSGLTHALVSNTIYGTLSPQSWIPTVGASGAIAGVLGAYFILYPRARVVTLIPIFILPWFVEIPAFIYLGLWLLSQVSSGLLSLGAYGAFGGIAWFAHIGGFLVGLLLVRIFARRPEVYRHWYPEEY